MPRVVICDAHESPKANRPFVPNARDIARHENISAEILAKPKLDMDPRWNIFFQYRGPSPEQDEFPRDRQLENNLTKALLGILYHTSPQVGRTALFSLLAAHPQARAMAVRFRDEKVDLGLQSVPSEAESAPHRGVMLITGPGSSSIREDEQFGQRGRPDAWIRSRSGSTLLIEAKLGSVVSRRQIAAHLKAAGWASSVPLIRTTWEDWHNVFSRVRSAHGLPPVDCFLLDQFLGYLEVVGVAPFTGFQAQDFDFFLHYDSTYRPRLRQKLQQFAEKVHGLLDDAVRQRYPQIYLGNIREDSERGAWAVFRSATAGKLIHSNLNIEINRDRLEFNAVIRDGRAMDSRKPIGILNKRLRAAPQSFEEILQTLGDNYAISVFARTQRNGSLPPRQGNERWSLVGMQRLKVVGEGVVTWLRFLINNIDFPGILVGRHVPRGDSLLKDPEKLPDEATRSLQEVVNVLEFLDG